MKGPQKGRGIVLPVGDLNQLTPEPATPAARAAAVIVVAGHHTTTPTDLDPVSGLVAMLGLAGDVRQARAVVRARKATQARSTP